MGTDFEIDKEILISASQKVFISSPRMLGYIYFIGLAVGLALVYAKGNISFGLPSHLS